MTSSEFPGNSKHPNPTPKGNEDKKLESVVSNTATTRKKGLGKRFKEIFIGGDSRSVVQYVFMDVLVPQAKDMLSEAVSQGFEKLIYGESRPGRRPPGSRPSGPAGYTNYNRYGTQRGNNPIGRSEPGRPPHASVRAHYIEDILLATRVEAETVLDRLYDLLREYESASVSDLYQLVGLTSNYVDQKWGWTDLHGSGVQKVRDGYILNLPKPTSLE